MMQNVQNLNSWVQNYIVITLSTAASEATGMTSLEIPRQKRDCVTSDHFQASMKLFIAQNHYKLPVAIGAHKH